MKRLAILTRTLILLALTKDIAAGPLEGPISKSERLVAFSTSTWLIPCKGGEDTTFEVIGDGSSDLDILVLSSDGKLVVQTHGPGDHCKVVVKCPGNTRVFVLVINRGPNDNNCSFSAR